MILDISHDIKTPATSILCCAKALEENMIPEEDKEQYYHRLSQKAQRISELINQISRRTTYTRRE